MALVYPSDPNTSVLYRRGSGQVYLGAWVTGGADASPLTHLGGSQSGIEFTYKRTMKEVDTDQILSPIAAFPSKEEADLKVTILDLSLANLHNAMGLKSATLTAGGRTDNSGNWNIGGENTEAYFQVIWKGTPIPASSAALSVIQLWKCYVAAAGALKFEKGKESGVQITFRALADPTAIAAGKTDLGKWFEA